MSSGLIFQVDPGEPSRPQGADPVKLARQIAKYGKAVVGMPPLELLARLSYLRTHRVSTRFSIKVYVARILTLK